MDIIVKIQQDLKDEVTQLNNLIISCLKSDEELIEKVGKYLLEAGGKRIRPLLTIITAKMFDYNGDSHIKLASAVEFIHTATLLHDDVVDDSTLRRFKPTANVIWGSKTSILVGDFLFSQSFKLMVASGSIKAMNVLAKASAIISEGEVVQLVKLNERRLINIEEYQQIVKSKTAELFGASCSVGAIIANQSDDISKDMEEFGRLLGTIFQVIDDLLDYLGNDKQVGKNIGDDFLEGKVTLPLIFLYDKLEKEDKAHLKNMIKSDNRTKEEFVQVCDLMVKHKISKDIINHLNSLENEAISLLNKIPVQNVYKEYLFSIIRFILDRSY
ncbi:octaprenyl-diphosphate synthase [Rickettsia sp. MEAM1 (Bemisia tabaci)]|uniref:polyprenyl synthetase family protein n=1 Tax=unclassified Rickettsia TaxID=114295 RepID=UPI0003067AA1|nr:MULTISPECIES: polyprenyl synthetase family protein [unclassified Rickettsia]ASX27457.1 octaprenyl-diphosphate synthase [Rickettsia sp. MEAM1 (Bemisia tabaci)]ODA36593.1 octaprenyl-diphosphate synthase [Rickettsia sp. wb]ODA36957.1 octaprenyl-diphosphate synthase [Rickettsia sp. wq]